MINLTLSQSELELTKWAIEVSIDAIAANEHMPKETKGNMAANLYKLFKTFNQAAKTGG